MYNWNTVTHGELLSRLFEHPETNLNLICTLYERFSFAPIVSENDWWQQVTRQPVRFLGFCDRVTRKVAILHFAGCFRSPLITTPPVRKNHPDTLITTPMISYLIYAPTMQYGGVEKRTVKSEQAIWLVQTDLKGDEKRGPTRKRRECTCH